MCSIYGSAFSPTGPSKESMECFPVMFTRFDLASLKVESAFVHLEFARVADRHVDNHTFIYIVLHTTGQFQDVLFCNYTLTVAVVANLIKQVSVRKNWDIVDIV